MAKKSVESSGGRRRIKWSEDGMKTLKISLIASSIGTATWFGAWVFGVGQRVWPVHPQMACFLLTLITTIVVQIAWPRLVNAGSQ